MIDTFYPQRPSELEDVCLYDFVANYGLDTHGKRQYRKLSFQTTSCLILKMKTKEKSFSTLLFSYSLHSEMGVVYFMTKKLQSKLSRGCLATRSLTTMIN